MDAYGGLSVDDLLDLPTDDFLSSDPCPQYSEQRPVIPRHPDALTDDILCVQADEEAELEWLSNYLDDSFTNFPPNSIENPEEEEENLTKANATRREVARRCTHCASEKTPQWRTGPLGPKTLCNACGVRYKSGRLVPEYRPAASPTFVLTQHSNSHRKVLELRRQKEMLHRQRQAAYGRHFPLLNV